MRAHMIALVIVLASTAACSLTDEPAGRAAPPPSRTVTIVAPRDGATVMAPVVLEVEVSGFELTTPDDSFEPDRGFLYAFVDTAPPTEDRVIRGGDLTQSVAAPQTEIRDLAPGRHTITVIAVHGYPVPFSPRVTDEVTFTVR